MGLGILAFLHAQFPLFIYVGCFIVCIYSLTKSNIPGHYFLVFILPFTYVLEKAHKYPFGNQILDVIFISLILSIFIHNKSTKKTPNIVPILLHCSIVVISFVLGLFYEGPYFKDVYSHMARAEVLKNYLLMPVLYWITFRIFSARDDKEIKKMTFFILFILLIVDWRFWNSFRWMSVGAHFSYAERLGAFGYLGANHLAAFVAEYVAIAVSLFLFYPSWRLRLFLAVVICASTYVVLFTYSRAAYLALAIVIPFFLLFKRKLLLPVILVALISGGAMITFLPSSVVERVAMTKTEDGEIESSAASRLELWRQGQELFVKNPILGIGYHMVPSYINVHGLRNLHNYIFQVLVETGIVGFSFFIYLLYTAFRSGWKLFKLSSDFFYRGLGLGFCGCIIVSFICNLFGDRWSFIQMQGYWWVFWAICDSKIYGSSTFRVDWSPPLTPNPLETDDHPNTTTAA